MGCPGANAPFLNCITQPPLLVMPSGKMHMRGKFVSFDLVSMVSITFFLE